MKNQLKKIGTLVTVAFGLTLSQADFAQAAYFTWTFEDALTSDGYLYFPSSPLKGVGPEQITFSALEEYYLNNEDPNDPDVIPPYFVYSLSGYNPFFDQDNLYYWTISNGDIDEAVFTFQSGELVGIELDNAGTSNTVSDDGILYPPSDKIRFGTVNLSLNGNTYTTSLDYTTTVYEYSQEFDTFVEVDQYFTANEPLGGGAIKFRTIVPIEPIPEPLTLLGTATAIGIGTIFKRKLNKTKN